VKDEAEVIDSIEGNALGADNGEFRIEDTLRSQNQMNRYAFHLADLAEKELALLWQNLAIDRRYWIPESGFQ
jgi:hypothetical protein